MVRPAAELTRCAHTPSARSSGRTAFPVDIPDDMMYEIVVDSNPDNLPTTHACIGLVRPCVLVWGCNLVFNSPLSLAGPDHVAECRLQRVFEAEIGLGPRRGAILRFPMISAPPKQNLWRVLHAIARACEGERRDAFYSLAAIWRPST